METPEHILTAFRLYHSAMCRAIDQGVVFPTWAEDDYKGIAITNEDGIRWKLAEKEPGALNKIASREWEALSKDIEDMRQVCAFAKATASINKVLAERNEALRALLGSPSESVTTVTRDPVTQELINSRSVKRDL